MIDGATSIGPNSFYKNNGVASVDLSTVASVGTDAFPYCNGLETLVISGSLSYAGAYAFFIRCQDAGGRRMSGYGQEESGPI